MSHISKLLKGRRVALLFAALGIIIMLAVVASRETPERNEETAAPRLVAFITAQKQSVVPRVTGHGLVRPATRYQAVTEVSGRLVHVHPLLQPGVFVPAGTLLVQLDATDYQLALEQAKTDQISAQSSLLELTERQSTLTSSKPLVIENLRIASKELARKTNLLKRGAISQSQVDTERRNVNQRQQEKLNLERDIAILPSSIALSHARLNSAQANIVLQRRNIERTQLRMPFDGRIAEIDAEENQFVATGHTLYVASGIDQVEISAQISIARLRPFLEIAAQSLNQPNASPEAFLHGQLDAKGIQKMIEQLGLHADVKMPLFPDIHWPARVISLAEGINPQSQTIGVLIAVDAPYENVQPGIKPPLLNGMQVTTELRSRAVEAILLPRRALHQHGIYTLSSDNRLKKVSLTPTLSMDNWLLLSPQKIENGTQVITTDLSLALPGMALMGQHDNALQRAITAAARPKTASKNQAIETSKQTSSPEPMTDTTIPNPAIDDAGDL